MKPIIYQLFPRLFANYCESPVVDGDIQQNGSGKLNDITSKVLHQIKSLGITHIWYTGIIEHANTTDYSKWNIKKSNPYIVKGKAGSPYAISDYYDIDPDIAESVPDRMAEFESLVKRTHDAGLKVIIDFVPNHVSRQYHSDARPRGIYDLGENDNYEKFFSPNNNFYYITRQKFNPQGVDLGEGKEAYVEFPAKASGNDCFTAFPGKNDWYDTIKLNYGVDPWNGQKCFDPIPSTWFKMLHILRFWASKGVDGFRCDMVHMVPLEFWQWAISNVHVTYPSVKFIAEIYDVNLYRPYIFIGGFDYLYDKVTLYDTLAGIDHHNVSAANLTSCWQTVEGINDNMLSFLENHDEVRFASQAFAGDPMKAEPYLVVTAMINRGAVMIYNGQELGEDAKGIAGYSGDDGRTTIFDYWNMPTVQKWLNHGHCDGELTDAQKILRNMYARILTLCNKEKAISDGNFFDLMYVNYHNPSFNPHSLYAFMRYCDNNTLLIVVNFDKHDCETSINIPQLALDMSGLSAGRHRCTELLTSTQSAMTIDTDKPLKMKIKGYGAVVWKFNHKKTAIEKSEK